MMRERCTVLSTNCSLYLIKVKLRNMTLLQYVICSLIKLRQTLKFIQPRLLKAFRDAFISDSFILTSTVFLKEEKRFGEEFALRTLGL